MRAYLYEQAFSKKRKIAKSGPRGRAVKIQEAYTGQGHLGRRAFCRHSLLQRRLNIVCSQYIWRCHELFKLPRAMLTVWGYSVLRFL